MRAWLGLGAVSTLMVGLIVACGSEFGAAGGGGMDGGDAGGQPDAVHTDVPEPPDSPVGSDAPSPPVDGESGPLCGMTACAPGVEYCLTLEGDPPACHPFDPGCDCTCTKKAVEEKTGTFCDIHTGLLCRIGCAGGPPPPPPDAGMPKDAGPKDGGGKDGSTVSDGSKKDVVGVPDVSLPDAIKPLAP